GVRPAAGRPGGARAPARRRQVGGGAARPRHRGAGGRPRDRGRREALRPVRRGPPPAAPRREDRGPEPDEEVGPAGARRASPWTALTASRVGQSSAWAGP